MFLDKKLILESENDHVMRDFRKLAVWKKAHEQYLFVKRSITSKFPPSERFELSSQLQRASLSVVLNIVEGCGRASDKDFAHFLDTALGSTNEVDYCCFAALELNYISENDYNAIYALINETRAMLISFIRFLRKYNNPQPSSFNPQPSIT